MANEKSVSFTCVSGINFPDRSRKYLMKLVKEVSEWHNSKFVIIAGGTISGKALETELGMRIKAELLETKLRNKEVPAEEREKLDDVKAKNSETFVDEMVAALNDFLPEIKGANYHIVLAEKVYDRAIGRDILEGLFRAKDDKGRPLRDDIRIFDDPETKIPVNLPGFGDPRVIVPRKQPWFYDNVTGLMQRLVNSFSLRTFSDAPPLILVGCTGTGAYLPEYRNNVPCISIPALHKLDEQLSTENMVGCVVVTITAREDGKYDIVPTWYDFRTAIYNEKSYGLPEGLSYRHRAILDALMPSTASLKTVHFRAMQDARKPWPSEKTKELLDELRGKRLVVFKEKQNRYAISESLAKSANLSLDEFLKDSKTITTVNKSCWHVGSLKTLYYTALQNEPKIAEDADAIILNGDIIQGISHNYEYNNEMPPGLNGPDKHEIFAGLMQAEILADAFARRWRKNAEGTFSVEEKLKRSLVAVFYKHGNHDEPRFSHGKNSIPLYVFDRVMRVRLSELIAEFCKKRKIDVWMSTINAIINEKIDRIGESRVAKVNGVPVGVKHPYQSRTISKGLRIQQTGEFFARFSGKWPDESLKNISFINVANFHEAAAIFMSSFGRTIFGVMTGALTTDTLFESNQNKVVNTGIAKSVVTLNKDGLILSASVQYFSDVADEDKAIVFADHLTVGEVLEHFAKLLKKFDMPLR